MSTEAASQSRPAIKRFSLYQYRAFQEADIKLGRLTLILGRNNAGKSALCFAPLHFAQAFRRGANAPLISGDPELDFGSAQSAIHRHQATGTRIKYWLEDGVQPSSVELGVTVLPERNFAQQVTSFRVDEPALELGLVDWGSVRNEIASRPTLASLAEEVGGLRGIRPLPVRDTEYLGYVPKDVGFFGQHAPMMLLSSGEEGLKAVNQWFAKLHVELGFKRGDERFEVRARGTVGEEVNLLDSGAGIAQVLPLFVQLEVSQSMPRLWCVEQPELHLHPAAHGVVADAILARLSREPLMRIVVETHSDAFVLRVRRAIAEGKLAARDVSFYFVDESQDGRTSARRIELSDEGTPLWWPEGVFAEPQREFFAIRRALAARRNKV